MCFPTKGSCLRSSLFNSKLSIPRCTDILILRAVMIASTFHVKPATVNFCPNLHFWMIFAYPGVWVISLVILLGVSVVVITLLGVAPVTILEFLSIL